MSLPNDQLDPQLRNALEQLKTVPPRDTEAASRGRTNFLAQAESLKQAVSQSANRRQRGWITPFSRRAFLAMSAAVFLLLCTLVGGSGVTVYAAQDSLPDTPLYPVKLLSEDALTALAFQPETKLELLLGFANRRVDEIAALNLQGSTLPESVSSRLQQQLDDALQLGAEMPDLGLTQTLKRVEATVQRQKQTLTRVQSQVAEPAKPVLAKVQGMLEERLGLVETGLTDPPVFRQQMRGRGQIAPPGQKHPLEKTPPAQPLRPTAILPEPERRATVTPPGQEHRPASPPPAKEHRP